MSTATLTAFTQPFRLKDPLIRFITLGGSYMDVTGPGKSTPTTTSRSESGRPPTATPPPAAPSRCSDHPRITEAIRHASELRNDPSPS
ncbi:MULTISPECIES: hypothetical protein [unclassified Streptomyces]|uniref:hypothetical protein n=1 Tax=unclassified Streptomyces TaxID=2593676 RepID=UPI002ED68F2C|nr:hypothetical protein OH827_00230 [Streptomyces sp. NBC_00891]WSY03541.1 hypothetical protein OG464_00230 [Streptomyces sp. NBC_00890]WSZ05168.1 hypothetical protein OG704_00230 [Streptomyces sp. NBC_00869]WSZ27337.1 hypothetical protein OG498_33335 [Streptomyces sp. NBC_00870]